MRSSETIADAIVDRACEAARLGLRQIGVDYNRADKFMDVFDAALRVQLDDLEKELLPEEVRPAGRLAQQSLLAL